MPEKLPNGWIKVKLGEVCLPVSKIRPEDFPDVEFTYFDIGGIDNETNRVVETKTITGRTAPSRARQVLRKDDILFSTVRTYLRKIARVEHEYPNPVASTGFTVIRAAEGVSPHFLLFQILTEGFLQPLHSLQTGSSYPAVRTRDVFAQSILLPPTREQERIAAKLNIAFSAVQRAETAAMRARDRLQRYRAAVLRTAMTGQLTLAWRDTQKSTGKAKVEMGEALLQRLLVTRRARWEETEFKDRTVSDKSSGNDKWKLRYAEPNPPDIAGLPELTESWVWASPQQISSGDKYALAIGPFGSNLKVSDYRDSGVPLIFVRNIRTGVFSGKATRFVSHEKAAELSAHQAMGGDILVTKMGNPPGDACLYPDNAPTAIVTADCIRLSLSKILDKSKAFFVHSLNSKLGRDQILQITKGVAQQKVSLARFSRIALPLPPLSEQLEIVREVDHRLSAADRLETTLERQLLGTRSTRQSLLRDAIAGHLVPQDATDEPASALIQRIRTTRAIESQKPKTKRMPKSKSQLRPAERRDLLAVLIENGGLMTPEELFQASGHSQESVDQFFAELRLLTSPPAKIVEERNIGTQVRLRAVS